MAAENNHKADISSVKNEIQQLHQFFEDWFNGKLQEHDISRFSSVLSDDFAIITPSGDKFDKNNIIKSLVAGFSTSTIKRIWVEDISIKSYGTIAVAEYIELQEDKDSRTKRISSAVFSHNPKAEHNWIWERVHETWVKT